MMQKAPASGSNASRMFTSCGFPVETSVNAGMFPRRPGNACIFAAAFARRKRARGKWTGKDQSSRSRARERHCRDPLETARRRGADGPSDRGSGATGMHAPVAPLIRIGRRIAMDGASKSRGKAFLAANARADPDVSRTCAGRQPGEGHASKPVPAAETLCETMSPAAINVPAGRVHRQVIHDLRKTSFPAHMT